MSQKGFIMELLAPAGTMENFMAALESVSYTHLDVYKRQP